MEFKELQSPTFEKPSPTLNPVSLATLLPEKLLPHPIFDRRTAYLKEIMKTAQLPADQKQEVVAPGSF